jgi:hypothetical protein
VQVVVVVLVGSVNDYQKESQFRALNAKKDDMTASPFPSIVCGQWILCVFVYMYIDIYVVFV